MVLHPRRPERLFLQHHWGLYRSDDCAESWQDIAAGVPSDFGFAMVMHPHDPDSCTSCRSNRTNSAARRKDASRLIGRAMPGRRGSRSREGLPQKGAYETVLRDAMSADALDPAGIYFGTRSGQLFGSSDEGKTWKRILGGLPSVVCVKTAVMEPFASAGRPRAPRRRRRSAGRRKGDVQGPLMPVTVLRHGRIAFLDRWTRADRDRRLSGDGR